MKLRTVQDVMQALATKSPGTLREDSVMVWRLKFGPCVYPSGPAKALALIESRPFRKPAKWSLVEVDANGPARYLQRRKWAVWGEAHLVALETAGRLLVDRQAHDSEHGRYTW